MVGLLPSIPCHACPREGAVFVRAVGAGLLLACLFVFTLPMKRNPSAARFSGRRYKDVFDFQLKVELVRISKGLQQMIGERATP